VETPNRVRGKPVPSYRQTRRREPLPATARKCGVRSAMPSSTALRKTQPIFLPAALWVYRSISTEIRNFCGVHHLWTPFPDEPTATSPENLGPFHTDGHPPKKSRPESSANRLTASAGMSYTKFRAEALLP